MSELLKILTISKYKYKRDAREKREGVVVYDD